MRTSDRTALDSRIDPIVNPVRPPGSREIFGMDEDRWNSVGAVRLRFVANPGHVAGHIRHAGVFDDQIPVLRKREVGVPDSMAATIIHKRRLFVEEGNAISVKKPTYLRLSAGLVRWFERPETILQSRTR